MRLTYLLVISSYLAVLTICSDTPIIPEFIIDFDLKSSLRYNEVFEHYKDQLKETQMLFVHSVPPIYRDIFKLN